MPVERTDEVLIYSKGTELDLLAKNLIELAYDENETTQAAMQQSIITLGIDEPRLLLSLMLAFLKSSNKSKKVPTGHRIILLRSMKDILKAKIEELISLPDFVSDIITQVLDDMTSSKDIIPEWQTSASDVLVTLSSRYCNNVMNLLADKMQPSSLPHFFVIQTLGAMAANNPYDMVSYLCGIITQVLTLLSLAKTDNYRWVIVSSMNQFCEAIIEYVANPDRAPDKSVSLNVFSSYILSAFDIFVTSWLNTKEPKLRKALLDAIGSMVFIIERSAFETQLSKLLATLISQYKKHPEAHHVTKALSQVIQAATGQYPEPVTPSSTADSPVTDEAPLIVECASLTLEMENVISVLFNQLQQSLDATLMSSLTTQGQLNSVRNQNEVKRCFTTLCKSYPDKIISMCLHRLEGPEKQKISTLMVLRHVISSCDSQLKDKRSQLIAGLRSLVGDIPGSPGGSSSSQMLSNNVKMQLSHVIIAMGGQGYLSEVGGTKFIEFIVRNCALPSKNEPKNRKLKLGLSDSSSQQVTNEQLRSFCENVLQLGSSTVHSMRPVLWPYLLELVTQMEYTEAIGAICNSIHVLFSSSVIEPDDTDITAVGDQNIGMNDAAEDIDYMIDYDIQVNIPKPQFLMARLLILAGVPLANNNRGISILRAMKVLVYNLHENLPPIWNIVIPKLIDYLEKTNNLNFDDTNDCGNKFDILQWEELLLKLVAKSIEHINDEEWTVEFGTAMGKQISLYDNYHQEKGFLFKCLGSIMANSNKKSFYEEHLDFIFKNTKHGNIEERNGFAVGFGLCAASHLDTVLSKLEICEKQDSKKSIFSLLKDKSNPDNADKELVRASILLAYTNALYYAPKELVPSRFESCVVKALEKSLKHNKEQEINRLVIESIDLIARSLHPNKLDKQYRFEMRTDVITCLLNLIENESATSIQSDIRSLAMQTIGNLVVLFPPITNVEMQRILNVCCDNILSLPIDGIPLKKSKELAFEDAQHLTILMKETLSQLGALCIVFLKTYFSNLTLNELYKVLRDKIKNDNDYIRERALSILDQCLTTYCDEITDTNNNGIPLNCTGTILGDLIPRLADPDISVRQLTVDCIATMLKIQLKIQLGRDGSSDPLISTLSSVKERLKRFDSNILFAAVNDVSKIICKKLQVASAEDLLASLYIGLNDKQKHGASAVCVMLNVLFRIRSADLGEYFVNIITTLHDILPTLVDNPRTGVHRALKILSSNYLIETLNCVMAQTLPIDEVWKEILCNVTNETLLLDKCLVHLIELLSRSIPFEERDDPSHRKVKGSPIKMIRYPCHVWLAALNCLQILFSESIECGENCLTKMYSKLLTIVIMACGTMVICTPFTGKSQEKKSGLEANLAVNYKPISIAADALKNFLLTTKSHELTEEVNVQNGWEKLETEEGFMDFIFLFTRSLCHNKVSEISNVVAHMSQYSHSNYEQHRIVLTGFFGSTVEGLAQSEAEGLIDIIVAQLISRLGDKSVEVRRLSLIGMGNVGRCTEALVQKHSACLLSTLLMGMDDRQDTEDKLINASMDGLASLMAKLTEKDVRDVLITICLRMLSCYERDSPSVRASAFRLFGSLAKLATGPTYSKYVSELNSVIVPLLVHLEDQSSEVVRACKYSLKQVMPIFSTSKTEESEPPTPNKINDFIQNCLREDGNLHFGEFCNDFAKLLIVQMPKKANDLIMRSLVYFKSEYPELAASSVLLIGFLMFHLPESERQQLQKGQICIELIQLLRSKDSKVRSRTAEAISLLHMY